MLNILNSVAACALITWSYAASLRCRMMQRKTEEEPARDTILERIKTVLAAETDEEKSRAYYIALSVIRSLHLCIDENDQLTIKDFLQMTPCPVEEESDTECESETNSDTPSLEKHVTLLERFIDELRGANEQWAAYANELQQEKKQLELEKKSIYRMTYTVLLVGAILVPVYTMIVFKHLLTN